ncbi:hypothetical protein [Streptosporangium sp. CA-115845]|uniref:hypothetical protein n=1 Tax=Streptosporangium sp. CA-115845 TaxID=3240071 RepID=UPI003D8C081A
MSKQFDLLASTAGNLLGPGPVIEGWQTRQSRGEVFFARRTPGRVLTERDMRAGLTRYLVAETAGELLRLATEQEHIEDRLKRTPLKSCPHCGRVQGETPLIVTATESVTAERCARSYGRLAGCEHVRAEWTYRLPFPDGARCRDCGACWQFDLIPAQVSARLNGHTPS